MKFLTEDDLRVKYHKFPFETFTISNNMRLTPGAKTFLMDRKITIIDENDPKQKAKKAYAAMTTEERNKSGGFSDTSVERPPSNWFALRCECLKVASDLAELDLVLAQEISSLERCLAALAKSEEFILPPLLQIGSDNQKVKRAFLEAHLSDVSMFLQAKEGTILTRLYPLYFQLEEFAAVSDQQNKEKLQELSCMLGRLIVYYLGTTGGKDDESTTLAQNL